MTDNPKRIVLITGASGGIGLAAAKLFFANGDRVYGLSRRPCPEAGIESICADVTDEAAVRNAIKTVVSREGRLDVLVCNAGFGISGAVEFTAYADAKRQFDVNFFGTSNCIRAALPEMRRQGSGMIIVTSSVAGMLSIPFQAYYSASKAALNSLVLATANEVRPYGVRVAAIMPGDIKTGLLLQEQNRMPAAPIMLHFRNPLQRWNAMSRTACPPMLSHGVCIRVPQRQSASASLRRLQYKACCLLGKFLPCRLSNWIVGKMYASK